MLVYLYPIALIVIVVQFGIRGRWRRAGQAGVALLLVGWLGGYAVNSGLIRRAPAQGRAVDLDVDDAAQREKMAVRSLQLHAAEPFDEATMTSIARALGARMEAPDAAPSAAETRLFLLALDAGDLSADAATDLLCAASPEAINVMIDRLDRRLPSTWPPRALFGPFSHLARARMDEWRPEHGDLLMRLIEIGSIDDHGAALLVANLLECRETALGAKGGRRYAIEDRVIAHGRWSPGRKGMKPAVMWMGPSGGLGCRAIQEGMTPPLILIDPDVPGVAERDLSCALPEGEHRIEINRLVWYGACDPADPKRMVASPVGAGSVELVIDVPPHLAFTPVVRLTDRERVARAHTLLDFTPVRYVANDDGTITALVEVERRALDDVRATRVSVSPISMDWAQRKGYVCGMAFGDGQREIAQGPGVMRSEATLTHDAGEQSVRFQCSVWDLQIDGGAAHTQPLSFVVHVPIEREATDATPP